MNSSKNLGTLSENPKKLNSTLLYYNEISKSIEAHSPK